MHKLGEDINCRSCRLFRIMERPMQLDLEELTFSVTFTGAKRCAEVGRCLLFLRELAAAYGDHERIPIDW
jgi:hypothetical protein